jgi:hypothetical protein
VQGVDAEARVVGQYGFLYQAVQTAGLDQGVFREASACFFGGEIQSGIGGYLYRVAGEYRGKFRPFMGISRGKPDDHVAALLFFN